MLFNHPLPKRKLSCRTCARAFEKGEELVSVLREAEEEGKYLRDDLCHSCWEKQSLEPAQSPWLSVWRTRIPDEIHTSKKEMAQALQERALDLLHHYLEEPPQITLAYLLALYLERRKQLLRIKRLKEGHDHKSLLFEVRSSGEMIEVPRLEVINERERLQEELLRALSVQEEEPSHAPCVDC
jgi:hypothetical protein